MKKHMPDMLKGFSFSFIFILSLLTFVILDILLMLQKKKKKKERKKEKKKRKDYSTRQHKPAQSNIIYCLLQLSLHPFYTDIKRKRLNIHVLAHVLVKSITICGKVANALYDMLSRES